MQQRPRSDGGGEALASSVGSGIEAGEWTVVTRRKRTKRRYYTEKVKGER
jgi:hypothetical protein